MRKVLVVASRTLGGAALRRRLALKRSTDPGLELYFLVPDTPEDPGEAAKRLDVELQVYRDLHYQVEGAVGEADPLAAVASVVKGRQFDEIILSTMPVGASRWLRMDLPHRMARVAGLPVEQIVGEEGAGAEELGVPVAFPGAPALGPHGPVKVLLVEDNEADAELTRLALSRCATPNEVSSVSNGAEALEYLKSVGGTEGVHLMLVDLKMPVVDGFALLEALGREYDLDSLAVVVVTTSDRFEDRERAHQLGAHSYITKEPLFPVYRVVVDGLLAEVASSR